MSKAIGMIEFKTTATGVTAADAMVKTSDVEIVEAQTVCPGKYIAIITGDLSAVKAAVDAAVTTYEDKCIDSFVLGNPHESLFPAMYGTTVIEDISALGILETYDAVSIIEAADQAAKTAIVDVIELRIAKGMCGKSYMMITGEVSAVEASIQRAKELVAEKGMYGQKFIGVLFLGMAFCGGQESVTGMVIPAWLMLMCSTVMGLGTSVGGEKIIKSVGMDMVRLEKYQGFAADLAAAACLLLSSLFGIPVSTTHTKTSAIMGVGAVKRLSASNFGVVKDMMLTWVFTFPGCGLISFVMAKIFTAIF